MSDTPSEPGSGPRGDASGRTVAGRYRITDLLARGGSADVYRAVDEQTDQPVALKWFAPTKATRARREARLLDSLRHPGIVRLRSELVLPDGSHVLVQDLVPSPTLADRLVRGPLDPDALVGIVGQLALPLDYAHRSGVIHRDLKPANLLVGPEGCTLIDFGVALRPAAEPLEPPGTLVGSPHCMSPEQIRSLPVDARTDVYGLAVVAYRSLTGVYPFHGDTPAETLIAHLQAPLRAFSEVAPDRSFPAGLETTVRRGLARDPARRFRSIRAFAEALQERASPPVSRLQALLDWVRPPSRR